MYDPRIKYSAVKEFVVSALGDKLRMMSVPLDCKISGAPKESEAQGILRISEELLRRNMPQDVVMGAMLVTPYEMGFVKRSQIEGLGLFEKVEPLRLYRTILPPYHLPGDMPYRDFDEIRRNTPEQIAAMVYRTTEALEYGTNVLSFDLRMGNPHERAAYFPDRMRSTWLMFMMHYDEIATLLTESKSPNAQSFFKDYVLARYYYEFFWFWHAYARIGDERSCGKMCAYAGAMLGLRFQAFEELDYTEEQLFQEALKWWEIARNDPTYRRWAEPATAPTFLEDMPEDEIPPEVMDFGLDLD